MPLDPKQCPKCGSTSITKDGDETASLLLHFPHGERPPGDLGRMRVQHWTVHAVTIGP